ncbi:MAG TPA: cyclopropane-fatty-acyl-phospholipid synthase family protein [Solirubrobacteraceae bacterium]|nr:cyclopropane-fatty-acyl-phospholipid synthase family protein [Solirubrobacteraceae bacterium]
MTTAGPFRYELLDRALEHGLAPDGLLRAGSLYGAWARERREGRGGVGAQGERLRALVERMSSGPVAESVQAANEQHYELAPEFLGLILGPRRKYSGCLWQWPDGSGSLAQAEEAMLELSCERAGIEDGMRVLDLGCGWGSLTLWLAERYPACSVLGVSNSGSQREWILGEAARRGLSNVSVETADVNTFDPGTAGFDRVMSIEMFEHMRNWRELLRRISRWLEPGVGRAFIHVFSHRTLPYLFEGTWAAARFFTAGLMPSHDLMLHFQEDMIVRDQWAVPGTHYARTLRAWLARLDASLEEAAAVLRHSGRSEREARRLVATWRLFLLSTEVTWGYRGGERWLVSHYLLEPRPR